MVGLIAEKVGMTQIFKEDGEVVPVTVLSVSDNFILRKKTVEVDGYNALVLGSFPKKESKLNFAERGFYKVAPSKIDSDVFKDEILAKLEKEEDVTFVKGAYNKKEDFYKIKNNLGKKKLEVLMKLLKLAGYSNEPVKVLKEIRLDDVSKYEVGSVIDIEIFNGVEYLDVTANSKGKGFQGVMKRHGFSGGRATHGSKFHRQNGSTGHSAYPSRVFKGLRRAGRMGNDKVTTQNLRLVKVDKEKGVILVKGSVPGIKKGIVVIRKSVKK